MHNRYLNQKDYQNLLQFSLALTNEHEDYLDEILILLDELFQWRLSMYYILNRFSVSEKPVVQRVNSFSLEQSLLHKCKDAYMYDRIVHKALERLRFSKEWTGVLFTQDLLESDNYFSTTYHSILSEVGIYYTAVCIISLSPEIKVNIFKTIDEGPFTLKEMTLIEKTQQVMFTATKQHIREQDRKSVLQSMKELHNNNGIGCLVVDSNSQAYDCNDLFMAMASQLFGSEDLHIIAHEFLNLFERNGIALRKIREKATIWHKGFSLFIIPRTGGQHQFRDAFHLLIIKEQKADNAAHYEKLTNREREILALISMGKTNADISSQLQISQHTVKTHITNIFHKLNVTNRTEVVALLNDKE